MEPKAPLREKFIDYAHWLFNFDSMGRHSKNPMNDVRVRKAIAHAIDREGIVKALVKSESIVVNSLCFPSQFGCARCATYDQILKKQKSYSLKLAMRRVRNTFQHRNRDYAEAIINVERNWDQDKI